MEDVLGYPEAAKKPYDVDAYIKQLLIANSFENASKVLSACARNAKLWSSGSGTVASLNLLAVRYNCSTSEISSVVYALVRLCEIAGSKQVDGDEIESKLCVYGFDDSVAHDIVSFVCGQQSLESLTVCRSHAPVFSPYPRFRSLTARTEIKIGGMALHNAPNVSICIYLGVGDAGDEQALLLDPTVLSEIITQLEHLILNACKLERLSIK